MPFKKGNIKKNNLTFNSVLHKCVTCHYFEKICTQKLLNLQCIFFFSAAQLYLKFKYKTSTANRIKYIHLIISDQYVENRIFNFEYNFYTIFLGPHL